MWSSSAKIPSLHQVEWCTWHAQVMTQQHKVHLPQTTKGLMVILGILQTPYRQQCSPSTCREAIPAMKCLWGKARWLLDASYKSTPPRAAAHFETLKWNCILPCLWIKTLSNGWALETALKKLSSLLIGRRSPCTSAYPIITSRLAMWWMWRISL